MKKILVSVLAIVIFVCGAAMTACAPKSSSAVTIDELIREDFAAEKEAEDDAKGREHIEIPEGAEEIEIEGETWHVIRSIEDFKDKIFRNGDEGLSGDFILANDVDVKGFKPYHKIFKGRFNGNNYKFYGTKENGGFGGCLFYAMENAEIENVIFSASDGSWSPNSENWLWELLFKECYRSTIHNCINYWQPKPYITGYVWGLMGRVIESTVENCINYADLYVCAGGGIARTVIDGKIINCENYGNISGKYYFDDGVGGIAGRIVDDSVIENCINYGKVTGQSNLGGIVGIGITSHHANEYLNKEYMSKNQIIKNCKNYGDIYLTREKDEKRVEEIEWDSIYRIGGIAGSVTKVENCVNEGNFYGFESFGKGIYVDYSGGIVGIAKEVVDCTSTHTIPVPKNKAKNVGEIYGILLGD